MIGLASTLASKPGSEPMPRIAPSRGSIAIHAPALVWYSELEIACCERRVARLLQAEVERQLQPLALLGLGDRDPCAARRGCPNASTITRELPSIAAQVLVVVLLEPALADPRALLDPLVVVAGELLVGDLGDGPEQLRRELAVRVLAQVAFGDDDAGKYSGRSRM